MAVLVKRALLLGLYSGPQCFGNSHMEGVRMRAWVDLKAGLGVVPGRFRVWYRVTNMGVSQN